MTTRPIIGVYNGSTKKSEQTILMPKVLLSPIRPDLVNDVHTRMAKNKRQPYAVSKYAGHQTSAESWGTGRAVARIPRVSGGGTHRAGQGAFGNMCRGGRMFAPTKIWRRWHRKININQKRYAVASALAATAVPGLVMARGHKVDRIPEIPLVVDSKIIDNLDKTKKAVQLLKALGALGDVLRVKRSRHVRPGKGKLRNRRYIQKRGPLIIYDTKQPMTRAFRNIPGVELCSVHALNLLQLAPGGHLGRFVIWTSDALKKLDHVFATKKGFHLPRSVATNPDIGRIINSDEIQSRLRDKIPKPKRRGNKLNPLRNAKAMFKLNPYAEAQRRTAIVNALKKAEKPKKKIAKPVDKKFKARKLRLRKTRREFAKQLNA